MAIIGQVKTLAQLEEAITAARKKNFAPPHMLFSGHAGCGKTSMAKKVAEMLGTDFIKIIPENLRDHKSVMDLIDALNYTGYGEKGDRIGKIKPTIVFLDEIHNLPMYAQENFGIIMENFIMDTGKANKVFWVPYFTVIGATTLAGELSKPFLDRFKLNFFFDPYSIEESIDIIKMHADLQKLEITNKAAIAIAKRGRGVPRILVRYLERCSDKMYALDGIIITSKIVEDTFRLMGIDAKGYNQVELKILQTLYNTDKPLGLETLTLVTGESAKTIKNELERYLIRSGMMVRSGSGRTITATGRNYLEEQNYVGKRQGRVAIAPDYKRD